MRHLSIKQKAFSKESLKSSEETEQKVNAKSFAMAEDVKPQVSLGRTSPNEPCLKPCSTTDDQQGSTNLRPTQENVGTCKCRLTSCQKCRGVNGPLEDESPPPKANGPVDCNSSSVPSRQAELQCRTQPSVAPTDPPPTSSSVNHIGTQMVKKEPESTTESCTPKICSTAPTIWPQGGQQNHRNQTVLQTEECTTSNEKRSSSVTSSAIADTLPKGNQTECDPTKSGSLSSTPGMNTAVVVWAFKLLKTL